MLISGVKKMFMCRCGECKYHNDLCYKAPLNGIFVMFQEMVIVNAKTCSIINIHRKNVLILEVLLVISVIEGRGWFSTKGEGSIITLVKNTCKNI